MRELVERNELHHGEDFCFTYRDERRTFAEFAKRSRQLANALYGLGMRHQDRVSILAMNCAEYLEVYGAGEVASFIVSPVNFRLAPREIQFILQAATPKVLIFEPQYTSVIAQLRPALGFIDVFVCLGSGAEVPSWAQPYEDLLQSGSADSAPLAPSAQDIISVMFTSGTTGKPKGVMLTHEGMLALCENWAFELGVTTGDKMLLSMPLFHIGARSQGAAATFLGGTLVVHRSFEPQAILQTVQSERITHIHLAPTMVQAVLDVPGQESFDLSSIKTINYAAAPMPFPLLKRAMARFGPVLINGYGQTEGAGTALRKYYHRPNGSEKDLKRLTSIGQPTLGTEVRILDDDDREVATGQVGEICLRSQQNMLGYWNDAAATIATLRGGWLHTGDMGCVDEDGFIYLVDRKKDMIVSGGENIYSREVEEALLTHSAVADAAVIGVPDPYWGESVKAVVVLKQNAQASQAELIAHCKGQIASYKCPKSVAYVDVLPRLPSGKVSKVTLREQFAPRDS